MYLFTMGKKILVYLDSGTYPCPFDCLLAYDSGYDHIVNYHSVDGKKGVKIIQDVIFTRSEEDLKNTVFFIGGTDIKTAEKCFNEIKLFLLTSKMPQVSIIFDPNGIYTITASMLINIKKKIKDIEDKKILVLGGTGSIGQCIAQLLAEKKAFVTITSRSRDKLNGILSVLDNKRIDGFVCECESDTRLISKRKDIIITTGPPGRTMIRKETIAKINPSAVVDVSAIMPFGIENFNKTKDLTDLKKRFACIGGKDIWSLKNKIEKKILNNVIKKRIIYDKTEILRFTGDKY